jgi:hypothetical protein
LPGAARHEMRRCRRGIVTNCRVPDDPGPAAHHFVPHRIRETRRGIDGYYADREWLRAADFGRRFARKNPQLRHLGVIPVCTDDFGTLRA